MRGEHNARWPGFAVQTLLFILALIGITATATLSIWEAYQKFIVEPRTPGELERLRRENSRLRQEAEVLHHEARLFEAAEAIEKDRLSGPRTAQGAGSSGSQLPDELRFRGLSDEQIARERHQEHIDSAVAIVSEALSAPHSLPGWFDATEIVSLRDDIAAVRDAEQIVRPAIKGPGDHSDDQTEHPVEGP